VAVEISEADANNGQLEDSRKLRYWCMCVRERDSVSVNYSGAH
jgi:hypothetical protein